MIAKLIESSFNFTQLDPLSSYPIQLTCLLNKYLPNIVLHNVLINNIEYKMEIKKTYFISDEIILIHGFLSCENELGLVTFELSLSNN